MIAAPSRMAVAAAIASEQGSGCRQFLQDIQRASLIAGAAAIATPGAELGLAVFGLIGTTAAGLEIAIYSNNPTILTVREILWQALTQPLSGGAEPIADPLFDCLTEDNR